MGNFLVLSQVRSRLIKKSLLYLIVFIWFKKISHLRIDKISVGERFFSHMKGIVLASEEFSIVFFKKGRKRFPANRGNFYHIEEVVLNSNASEEKVFSIIEKNKT